MLIFNSSDISKTDKGLYKKQILRYGKYLDKYDNEKWMIIDKKLGKELIENKKRYPDIPFRDGHGSVFGGDKATDNLGWIETIKLEDDGVYAEINVLNEKARQGIEDGTIKHVSVGMFHNYLDNQTKKQVGARLEHLAAVDSPYIKNMKPFNKLSEDEDTRVYVLSELFDIKNKDVYNANMNKKVDTPTEPQVKASDIDTRIEKLEAQDLEARSKVAYAELLEAGKIRPAQKQAFLNFASTEDRLEAAKELFNVKEFSNMPVINAEEGTEEVPTKEDKQELSEEEKKVYSQMNLSEEDIKKYSDKEGK